LLGRPQSQLLARNGAQQIALGKVRPLIGQLWLRAYKLNLAGKTGVSQAGRNRVTGRATADDQRSGRFLSSSRKRRRDQTR
jgi:hypothetical protein